ncbi:vitelline membrane outer layer protein 1 homolog [Bufo bufo]|uniref:vitelline membrane outer layer protein 1 homolog n=1 Tax=Bufo bufo TaxID=8384 RepID=UPI001ABDDAC6|nr:vitelline membrane outer layer protein 1 homolog [Bufo bufo]
MLLPVLLLLITLHNLVAAQTIISVPNGQTLGSWGPMEVCDRGMEVRGFQLKVHRRQGPLDDTALNGIALYCTRPSSSEVVKIIRSTEGAFGSWGPTFSCNSGYLKNFSLRVEPRIRGDNTAANNIKFTCSDGSVLEGNGLTWGYYGPWSSTCSEGMRGIQVRVQERQGFWRDDVALTDVKFLCNA